MAKISEEQILVERFCRGENSAFDRIVERHAADIAALANRLLGWPQDVDDVVQDVFVAAFRGLRDFRGDCRLRTWLFTITVNRCRHYRRRYLRHARGIRRDGTAPSLCLSEDAQIVAIDAERFSRVRKAVRALPAKYREVVVLRYLQGLETAEICRLLGITTNALNVRLNRARERLKSDLSELLEEES
ncbi:MAG: RNA polymerase sigma factor [Planctomycetota bacterium]|jgi:RNA polymerase sigma-70 factor (ECF subfamily)